MSFADQGDRSASSAQLMQSVAYGSALSHASGMGSSQFVQRPYSPGGYALRFPDVTMALKVNRRRRIDGAGF